MQQNGADKMEKLKILKSILIHDVPEVKGEDTDSFSIEIVKQKMGLDISSADLDRTH